MVNRSKQSGFTLVELIITIALVGILAAIAAPSMSRFVNRAQAQGVASDVANQIRAGRDLAMSRGHVIVVSVETGAQNNGRGYIEALYPTDDPPPTSCREIDGSTPRAIVPNLSYDMRNAANGMTIQSRNGSRFLCFEPSGRMSGLLGLTPNGANLCTGESMAIYMATGSVGGGLDCGTANESDAAEKNYWRVSVSYSGAVTATDRNW